MLISIGLSGLVAEFMGRTSGPGFVAGDGPGVTYTAERCAEFVEYFPELNCADAATMHHFGEVVEYRVAAGVLGLLALLTLVLARRTPPLSDAAWSPPPAMVALALAASFGVAAALLGGAGLMALLGRQPSRDRSRFVGGDCCGVAFLASAAWGLRERSRAQRLPWIDRLVDRAPSVRDPREETYLAQARMPENPIGRSRRHPAMKSRGELTRGERAADLLRNGMGSWGFVLIALAFLAGWMAANGRDGFDPYPFILLNLILSCLAALQGAILLIAAKRADSLSRDLAVHDYKTNVEAIESSRRSDN